MKVNGNTNGIRDILLAEIEQLYDIMVPADEFISQELMERMAMYTSMINRELLVYISRSGKVVYVAIGDSKTVSMDDVRLVRNIDRLSGARCIHTHPSGDGRLSDVDKGSLSFMKLDAMAAIGVSSTGTPRNLYVGFVNPHPEEGELTTEEGPFSPNRIPHKYLLDLITEIDKKLLVSSIEVVGNVQDRAVLCGIGTDVRYDSISELAELAETAGIKVVGRMDQKKQAADPATYIGSGKAEELRLQCCALEADVIIFDDELSAIQMRNLEQIIGLPIIDRTMLILDIFAQRAQSREGKLQVELAQLKYRLPRLMGMGRVLSRQGAGVGMRGPGEKKLEIDRRRIKRRIFELQEELNEVEKQRTIRKTKREKNAVPVVALVGYTNAGKSTLLNALSNSNVLAENMLFATLDPVVRNIVLPEGTECLISDTVGFINKLPHELINAFKSTLEEVKSADLILHIIDSTSPYMDVQNSVVEETLATIEAVNIPVKKVYNKMDMITDKPLPDDGITISAKTGKGLDTLLSYIESVFKERMVTLDIVVPYEKYDVVSYVHANAKILSETHEDDGTHIRLMIPEEEVWKLNIVK